MSFEESASKRPRMSHKNDSVQSQVVIAGPSNQYPILMQHAKIFKLNIDCFDEIFEYLSINDLHSFSQTCKTMQKVACEYFKQNYSAAEIIVKSNGIHTMNSNRNGIIHQYGMFPIPNFNQFITSITSPDNQVMPLRYICRRFREFGSIRSVCFKNQKFDEEKGEELKKIWPNVETVQIRNCQIDDDLHDIFLTHCKNIKHLFVGSYYDEKLPSNIPYVSKPWFCRQYPTLQHFGLIPIPSMNELCVFFENNRNITSFSTSGIEIWRYKNEFIKSNIQLDLLKVQNTFNYGPKRDIISVLEELYEKGFYKRLYYYTCNQNQESNQLALLSALETLCIENFNRTDDLSQLTNLKELAILRKPYKNAKDMEILANSLVNLRRLYIENAKIDDILPFICRTKQLTKIKAIPGDNEDDFIKGILKLKTLNKEREKLGRACKLTIYVPNDIFLNIKWATINGNINLSLIEIRRSDSYEWNHEFC